MELPSGTPESYIVSYLKFFTFTTLQENLLRMKSLSVPETRNLLIVPAIILLTITIGCEDDPPPERDKFIGSYSVVETCCSGDYGYDITIQASASGENRVTIYNLWELDQSLTGIVTGSSLGIPDQDLDGFSFNAEGNLSGNKLTLSYTVIYEIEGQEQIDICIAICTRQ
jgi:hypothetical protein